MSARFLRETLERAAKTFCQVAIAMIGGNIGGMMSTDVRQVLITAAYGAVLSVLTSVGSARLSGDPDSPSLVPAQPAPESARHHVAAALEAGDRFLASASQSSPAKKLTAPTAAGK